MTEFQPKHYEVSPGDDAHVTQMVKLIERNLRNDQFSDPVEKAFLGAVVPHLQPDGLIRTHMAEVFALKRKTDSQFTPGYALRAMEFSVDKQMRQLFDKYEYPTFFSREVWWNHREVFRQLDYDEMHHDIVLGLQSNMHNAYAIYPLLMPAYKDRLGQNPVVLDNGISFGLGLKKWFSKTERFEPIRVIMPPRPGQAIVPGAMEGDPEAQEWVDRLSLANPVVRSAVGYDTISTNPQDPEAVKRVFSHTFPMSESLRRPDEVAEFYRLAFEETPDLVYVREFIDATDEYLLAYLKKYLPPDGAAAGIYSAVLFQHNDQAISRILKNTEPYYKAGAPLFIADFAQADSTTESGLRFVGKDWWHRPGSFALFVIDDGISNLPVEVARFTTRRGEEMWLTQAGRQLLQKSVENS